MSEVKIYTNKDTTWINASGDVVPLKFVPKSDKIKESLADKIRKQALDIETRLNALHEFMNDAFNQVSKLIKEEYNLKTGKEKKPGKGSFTWFSFDRSIKIEGDVNDFVKWDEALMSEAYELFNDYLSEEIGEVKELIKGLLLEGFKNSKNMIDTRKVFQILKYETKIKNSKFLKGCKLIKQAQGIDKSKFYMRVWEKTENGEYRNINLNFSSI